MDRKTNDEMGKRKKTHLGRFRHIHAYSGILRHIQICSGKWTAKQMGKWRNVKQKPFR